MLNELELAPAAVVKQAARDFAATLAETPQFKAYEETADRLNHDTEAQQAIAAFEAKQESLKAMLMLNAVSEADQAELQRLQRAFSSLPAVKAYFQAQADLMTLCQTTGDFLSQAIG
ncbi:MAG: YlbF family regulator [Chloroflexi bacterium]|nr:YlbF family regulator [Chloroflexota bacterium]